MADYDPHDDLDVKPDAETLLTPLTKIGPTARSQMVRALVDAIVLPADKISGNERAFVADILLQLLDNIDVDLRVEVATRVARVVDAPEALVGALMLDVPEVSNVIIGQSEQISEALLISTALHGEFSQRMAIAKRIDLSTPVADAVVRYEELDVCQQVLKRENCVLSNEAIDKLVVMSALAQDLQAPLLRRQELDPVHGFIMFWWVDAEKRRRILTRFALDRRIVQNALSDLYPKVLRSGLKNDDDLVREILLLTERRHRPRGADGEPISMEIMLRTLAAARNNPSPEIIHAVSMIAGVSRELIGRVLRDGQGEPWVCCDVQKPFYLAR